MNNKTLEGSMAFLISGLIVCAITMIIFEYFNDNYLILFISIFVATIFEHITPSKFDNITIPFSMGICLTILFNL